MFKSKAVNAQGTILAIDDGDGTVLADITAITKASSAVVSSLTPPAVGDAVRFGVVADMPEIEGLIGVVTASAPGTFTVNIDSSGFALAGGAGEATVLGFIPGCEVKTFNGFDGQAAEVDVTTLCSTAREYLMGLQDFGSFNFELNLVPDDPFQMECNEAKAARDKRAFKLTLPEQENGKQFEYTFDAFCRQFSITGGVDTALTGSVVLRVTGEPTLAEIV